MKTTRKLLVPALIGSMLVTACASDSQPADSTNAPTSSTQSTNSQPAATTQEPDIAGLSDEFDNADTLSQWKDLAAVEGHQSWVETLDINKTNPGELYLVPYVSAWFEDFRGTLHYKEITGNFDVTTRLQVKGKQNEVPDKPYSLTGLMARAPRPDSIKNWEAKKENWVFITTGFGDESHGKGVPQLETKTTVNSKSDMRIITSKTGWVNLRMIRMGSSFYMLYQFDGGDWMVSRKFDRPDLPETLQIGLISYTDWDSVLLSAEEFSKEPKKLAGDMTIRSDYVRFARPKLPENLQAKMKDGTLTNQELLEALKSNQ